jgi:hypothetical protein
MYHQQQEIPIGPLQRLPLLLIVTKKETSVNSYCLSHNYPFEAITS